MKGALLVGEVPWSESATRKQLAQEGEVVLATQDFCGSV
jgi:hypothetical protein